MRDNRSLVLHGAEPDSRVLHERYQRHSRARASITFSLHGVPLGMPHA